MAVYESGAEGITVSDLAERLRMPTPAVSRLLKGLEKNGLIQRTIMPQERRSILVSTTGHAVCKKATPTLALSLKNFETGPFHRDSEPSSALRRDIQAVVLQQSKDQPNQFSGS